MRRLTPDEVFAILIHRLEKRADILDMVGLDAHRLSAIELRNFARTVEKAREYLKGE